MNIYSKIKDFILEKLKLISFLLEYLNKDLVINLKLNKMENSIIIVYWDVNGLHEINEGVDVAKADLDLAGLIDKANAGTDQTTKPLVYFGQPIVPVVATQTTVTITLPV
jgi:hypothetical protein